jgi:hypothetical protein
MRGLSCGVSVPSWTGTAKFGSEPAAWCHRSPNTLPKKGTLKMKPDNNDHGNGNHGNHGNGDHGNHGNGDHGTHGRPVPPHRSGASTFVRTTKLK